MNNGVLIALGLGAVAAAVVLTRKKEEPKLSRLPPGSYDPNAIARRSPGQPQFNNLDPNIFRVNFNG